jgi:hypothetical protein
MPHVRARTMLIYIIMTSFRIHIQGDISINYLGSNYLIYGTVEQTNNTLVSWASYEVGAGNGGKYR